MLKIIDDKKIIIFATTNTIKVVITQVYFELFLFIFILIISHIIADIIL